MRRRLPRPLPAAMMCMTLVATGGCAPSGAGAPQAGFLGTDASLVTGAQHVAADPAVAGAAPGPLTGRIRRADVLLVSRRALPSRVARRVSATEGVAATVRLAVATAPVGARMVTLAAADPSSFRRFTPEVSARADAVWQRVAEGDLAITPALSEELHQELGQELVLGNAAESLGIRVGARASMPPNIDAVVNEQTGQRLGMVAGNAVLVSTGRADVAAVAEALRRRVGKSVTVTPLTGSVPEEGRQTAFLTGGSVADAVGSFSYRYFPDGTVEPDPAWVAAHIHTEAVPILGHVTCHRVLFPQLRGALQEVVDRGLSHRIDPGDFGGCYVPRFIGHDPAKGLSLHTWGIALDLNVQGNLRGTIGEIDRRVVDIFKRWGFAWGGDWRYTDPMHFELAALVQAR
jgi:hypothetical protein